MKLDRFHCKKVLAVAAVAMLPMGSAQALDLYDSLKTLLAPTTQDSQIVRDSPARNAPNRGDRYESTDPRGAQGPYRSDTDTIVTDQPVTIVPADPYENTPYQSAPPSWEGR